MALQQCFKNNHGKRFWHGVSKETELLPAHHGVSKLYSPRMILHQENLSFKRHCKYAFGKCVLAHNEPDQTSTQAPRALDCIYLRPSASDSGHGLLHLQTNAIVNPQNLTSMPLTPSIVKQVQKLAELDNMPKGLKITNKT
eukprot:9517752-Ditylum_brightwellii.AAC.1